MLTSRASLRSMTPGEVLGPAGRGRKVVRFFVIGSITLRHQGRWGDARSKSPVKITVMRSHVTPGVNMGQEWLWSIAPAGGEPDSETGQAQAQAHGPVIVEERLCPLHLEEVILGDLHGG
jgi:hypothetical protein